MVAGSRDALEPVAFGRYTLLAVLGRGSHGEVYFAQERGADAPCVLKTLVDGGLRDSERSRRFEREAQLAARLDHPNIARLTDAGFEGERFYIASEFIAGKELRELLQTAGPEVPLSLEVAVSVVLGVLDGLAHAHDLLSAEGQPLGVVHRDLSPRNILLGFDGRVKVIDFGVAHAEIDDLRTAPGTRLGTPCYMSPEQAAGGAVDRRSDLYAVAVVLYEMLTGRLLVPRGKLQDVAQHVLGDPPPPLDTVEALSPAVARVLARGLDKAIDRRWQSAREFRSALSEAAGIEAIRAEPIADRMRSSFPDEERRAGALLARALVHRGTPADAELGTQTVSQRDLQVVTVPESLATGVTELPTQVEGSLDTDPGVDPRLDRTRPAARAPSASGDTPIAVLRPSSSPSPPGWVRLDSPPGGRPAASSRSLGLAGVAVLGASAVIAIAVAASPRRVPPASLPAEPPKPIAVAAPPDGELPAPSEREDAPPPPAPSSSPSPSPSAPVPAPAEPGHSRSALVLHTSPEGATVYRAGERLGVTPLKVPLRPRGELRLKKAGYLDQVLRLDDLAAGAITIVLARAPAPNEDQRSAPKRDWIRAW
jgi:serine/threonine-protein kinase